MSNGTKPCADRRDVMMEELLREGMCTGFYVGPEVSEDGTTILGQSADAYENCPAALEYVPAVDGDSPRKVVLPGGFEYEFPAKTLKASLPTLTFCGLRQYGGNSAMNSAGVAFVGAITGLLAEKAKAVDPCVASGISESFLSYIVALTCGTAKAAVDTVCDLADRYGSCSPSMFIAADQQEAWIIELYSGHQYAASLLPRDAMFVSGNEFMLTSVSEGPGCRVSAGLVSTAVEGGFAVFNDDGTFNPRASYCEIIDYTRMRNWMGTRLFYAEPVENFEDFRDTPSIYTPKRKVSLKDILAFTRSRFEGTPFCPEDSPNTTRVAGIESMSFAGIVQIHHDLPAPVALVRWFCIAPSEFSVYMPLSNAVDSCIDEFAAPGVEKVIDGSTAYGKLKLLNAVCSLNRALFKKGVSQYWNELENYYIEMYRDVPARIASMPYPEAAEYVTGLARSMQKDILADAERLYEQCLLHHIMNAKNSHDVVVFPGYFAVGPVSERFGWVRSDADGCTVFSKGEKSVTLREVDDPHDFMYEVTADGETAKNIVMKWKGDVCLPMSCYSLFSGAGGD